MIGAVKLDFHPKPEFQLQKVVALQDHEIEFRKQEGCLPVKAMLGRFEGHHVTDGDISTIFEQEIKVVDHGEPIVIVYHSRVGVLRARGFFKGRELIKHRNDTTNVVLDIFVRQ